MLNGQTLLMDPGFWLEELAVVANDLCLRFVDAAHCCNVWLCPEVVRACEAVVVSGGEEYVVA